MDRASLTDEVRNYLQQKRYVVVFDDVWSVHFWDDIEFAVIDNKNEKISKLRKLRHLIGDDISLIELKNGIGEMASLQTLCNVDLDMDGAAEVIKEFGKLKQMRDLWLINVRPEDGNILSSLIDKMQHLEKLSVQLYKNTDELNDFGY
ncbi:hypothetical protein RYX36_016399 [Vicia faba]